MDEAGDHDARVGYLAQLRRLLPECEPWEEWLRASGELPPDFDALPSQPALPDPLEDHLETTADGRRVRSTPCTARLTS
jgi:hypothetical protein